MARDDGTLGPVADRRGAATTGWARLATYRVTGWRAVAMGLALVAFAAAVRLPLWPVMGATIPLATFFPAVIVTAFFGTALAAGVAMVTSFAVAWWWLLPPARAWSVEGDYLAAAALFFYAVCLIDVALIRLLRSALEQVQSLDDASRSAVARAEALTRDVEEARNRLAGALNAGRMGTYEWRVEGDRATWDETAYALWDVPPGTPITKQMVRARIHPDDVAAFDADMARAMDPAGDGIREVTYRVMGRDGTEVLRWLHVRAQMEFAPDGTPSRMVGVNRDVTNLKRAEAERELLIHELDHRVKNLFAVIASMLSLAARRHDRAEALVEDIRPRIEALARAHGSSLGRGAIEDGVDLRGLLENVLAPHRTGTGRVILEGPDVVVRVSAVTPLGLMVHELATNAAKHGALSVADGHVRVGWTVSDGAVDLTWSETGGPPAERAAGGFGATMLEAAAQQLRGTLSQEPTPAGLGVRLGFPLSA